MGRKLAGQTRVRNGVTEIRLRGKHLGSFADPDEAARVLTAAVRIASDDAPDLLSIWADRWWHERELAATKRKRHRSFKKELSVWRAHVMPAKFFNWPVRRIQPKAIKQWLDDLGNKEAVHVDTTRDGPRVRGLGHPISRRVLEQALKYLKLCLDDAITAGYMPAPNPARLVKLPRKEVQERDGQLIIHLLEEEIDSLFDLDLPQMQRAVFATGIYAGLRDDELWGLRWPDVTLDGPRPTIRVRRSYNGPCKTATSIRDVPLLPQVIAELRAWRATHVTPPIAGLVFPGEDGGCHAESYTAGWRARYRRDSKGKLRTYPGWRAKAGIRDEVDFKDLRHTCGCHLVQGTWTPRPLTLHEVKMWLGHSSISVTERHYAALTPDNLHAAIGTLKPRQLRAQSRLLKSGNKVEGESDDTL